MMMARIVIGVIRRRGRKGEVGAPPSSCLIRNLLSITPIYILLLSITSINILLITIKILQFCLLVGILSLILSMSLSRTGLLCNFEILAIVSDLFWQ